MASPLLSPADAKRAAEILCGTYKDAHYYLDFSTPVELLVAAIMSAQTRDETVNSITPALFRKYRSAADYAGASQAALAKDISRVSFAGAKAKNIISACKIIVENYGGNVPGTADALVALPGIGRKTANTILINAFGIVEGIPVDTWVIKLSQRIGFSQNSNPDRIEGDLMSFLPRRLWGTFAYVLKAHGKSLCGKVPVCSKCQIGSRCMRNGVVRSV